MDRLGDRGLHIERRVPRAKPTIGETAARFVGVEKGRHHHRGTRALDDFGGWQQRQAARENRKPAVGRRLEQKRDGEFVRIGREVVKDANGRIAAGDQTMRGIADLRVSGLGHFMPRHASM